MPYRVGSSATCPASKPFAVLGPDGRVMGCHETKEKAGRQMAALYANEPAASKAQMRAASINDLPDSAFAYIEPGGSKDDGGRTVPRSKRHFPIHDAAHVRNALSRAPQSPFGQRAMAKIKRAAAKFGIEVGDEGKAGTAAYNASRGAQILSQLYELMACEMDQPEQLALLEASVSSLSDWLTAERAEIGTAEDVAVYDEMMPMKAWQSEMKAEPMEAPALDRWLQGKIPRRILVVPFGGPLPGGKAGLDLDGEYFDEETDLFGPFPALRQSRARLVDWHHDAMYGGAGDPTGRMKGAILGRIELDESSEADGLWADFWANAGEKRRQLLAVLEQRGVPLFGSSQAVGPAIKKASDGHIEVWPIVRHTITTSPQNTHAIVPPLKALLTAGLPSDTLSVAALKAAIIGDNEFMPDPLGDLSGEGDTRARAERKLETVVTMGTALVERLRQRTA